MGVQLISTVFEARDPDRLGQFWSELLDVTPVRDNAGTLLPGDRTRAGLRFAPGVGRAPDPNPTHLHLVTDSVDDQQVTVAAALARGAVPADVGQGPDADFVVLADPEGNEFCVLLRNNYLVGTGFFGEIAGTGSRSVGLFWSQALSWPLVWDRDGETVVQSPHGGTKVAWSGTPATRHGPRPQHLEAATDQPLGAEIDRLLALGAAVVDQPRADSAGTESVRLADPDGYPFVLRVG
ncbi:VOC family protein [Nakamurella aerolata]|uniref:VOC family protein n=1 Tax=Nakamurella aerolata TaxID=1656892 RepID=A0A849A5M2_9ACTN|nr:VOC family protein [Nakamurella aerolata]NNG34418.1 VOC family protein [Nakamurella aerolata]